MFYIIIAKAREFVFYFSLFLNVFTCNFKIYQEKFSALKKIHYFDIILRFNITWH